jgi:peptidyl-dipeptidase Dcp
MKLTISILTTTLLLMGNTTEKPGSTLESHQNISNTETLTPMSISEENIITDENPFLRASTLPFMAPDFNVIRNEHFIPAFEAGMSERMREIEAIAAQQEVATFENTIVAMERAGETLSRVSAVFFNLTSANTSPEIQAIQREVSPKLSAHNDNIMLNEQLFHRVRSLYDNIDSLEFSTEEIEVLKRYYRNFVRAGALLNEDEKTRIREINERLSALGTDFNANLLEISRERAVVVDSKEELDGLSSGQIAAAAEAAANRDKAGKYLLSITNTTRQPILTSLNNREVRKRVWEASAYRGLGRDGGINNQDIILEIAALRAERSKILGFVNFSEFALETQMIQNPDNALSILVDLLPAVKVNVQNEAEEIRNMMSSLGHDYEIEPWDWEYYAEKVRQLKYDIDDNEVKPYFELNNVLNNGIFYAMNRLYGISFEERFDLPVYHEDVRVWNVYDRTGEQIALFYGDYFARDSKRGGAWMSSYVSQSHLLGHKPVVLNVLNIPPPAEGEPALVSFSNVVTIFHEMGHAVHGMFSDVTYPSVAGTSVPRDFVEFPSTFEEDWAIHPEVLANYAIHYETGEKLPAELLERIIAANTFNQGFDTYEYIAASLLDLEWHLLTPNEIPTSIEDFEAEALAKYGMDLAYIPPRYKTAFFAHVWPGGYASSYYAYLWSELLAADAFEHIGTMGGLTLENGTYYRRKILSQGGSNEPMQTYVNFRGQEPTVEALLRRRGLVVTGE